MPRRVVHASEANHPLRQQCLSLLPRLRKYPTPFAYIVTGRACLYTCNLSLFTPHAAARLWIRFDVIAVCSWASQSAVTIILLLRLMNTRRSHLWYRIRNCLEWGLQIVCHGGAAALVRHLNGRDGPLPSLVFDLSRDLFMTPTLIRSRFQRTNGKSADFLSLDWRTVGDTH